MRFEHKEVIRSPKRLAVFLALFGLSLLSVLHLVGSHLAFLLTVLILLVADRSVLKKVDYWLLATFVCFFIFAGNMGAIPSVQHFLGNVMERNTMLCAVASSQIISNVPAAVLLSNFTRDAKGMLLGTNIGGLGTLVASLASLISFKLYARTRRQNFALFGNLYSGKCGNAGTFVSVCGNLFINGKQERNEKNGKK